ncbi:hypothetical protein KR054_005407 [Drosophila jambulina]|nr:hypothetical protein KR054_005407 [Drosophila jambulina]
MVSCWDIHLQDGILIISNPKGIPDSLNISTVPFEKIGNHYYYIQSDVEANWFKAAETCAELDAKLIDFDRIEEWNLVTNYLNDTNIYKSFWTSATNFADPTFYTWFSNGNPVSIDIWYPGEPNNLYGLENCAELARLSIPTQLFGLNDLKCSATRGYICKARQPKTVSVTVW